jgi:hypothetical protein
MGTGDSRRAAIGCHERLVKGVESEDKEEKQQSAVVLGQQKDGQWSSGHGEAQKGKKRYHVILAFRLIFSTMFRTLCCTSACYMIMEK